MVCCVWCDIQLETGDDDMVIMLIAMCGQNKPLITDLLGYAIKHD